jgi:hypothetical protein
MPRIVAENEVYLSTQKSLLLYPREICIGFALVALQMLYRACRMTILRRLRRRDLERRSR